VFEIYRSLAAWLVTLIELLLVITTAAMIFLRRPSASNSTALGQIERIFGRLAAKRTLSMITVAFLALSIRAALIPLLGIPRPRWNESQRGESGKAGGKGKLTGVLRR
jgi:hypothetical protein